MHTHAPRNKWVIKIMKIKIDNKDDHNPSSSKKIKPLSIISNSKIPQKIHFIWLGGAIPKEYLFMIYHLAALAKKSNFKINLWVDHSRNIQKTAIQEDIHPYGLRIRLIDELKLKMSHDELFKQDNQFNRFWGYVLREMVGFKNYAAASDILRVEILRQEGGYYIDTDSLFEFDHENTIFKLDHAKYGFLANGKFTNNDGIELDVCNDHLASVPYGEILEKILLDILKKYQSLDLQPRIQSEKKQLKEEKKYFITRMDLKRKPFENVVTDTDGTVSYKEPKEIDDRFNLTLDASGPGIIFHVLLKKISQDLAIEEHNTDYLNRTFFFKRSSKDADIIAGKATPRQVSTLSWIKQSIPCEAFDDNMLDYSLLSSF